MTRSVLSLADRLHCLGVTRVVMEATSDHWKPIFYILEAAVPRRDLIMYTRIRRTLLVPILPKDSFAPLLS
jgi:hypothetical protein